jgi:hypothetical protein
MADRAYQDKCSRIRRKTLQDPVVLTGSEQFRELSLGEASLADESAQRAFGQFAVIRNRKATPV